MIGVTSIYENTDSMDVGNEINVSYSEKFSEKLETFNEKVSIFREIVLTTLKTEVERSMSPRYHCCDAIAGTGTGLAGLQWKQHLGDKVTVVCGDKKGGNVRQSCDHSKITATDWHPFDCSQNDKHTEQGPDTVYLSTLPTRVLLQSCSFDFVYLHVQGNLALYMESIFSNLHNGAVACILCPDISGQCFRSPRQIQRQFYAYTQKTMYVSEMAARIILGDIVRTAGRHGRVVDVLCTLLVENHFFFIVKVQKSSQMAGEIVDKCRPVLHCLMCEERVVYPATNCPVEMPYDLLPCECKNEKPGKTAVILGPMWVGAIYNVTFLVKLKEWIERDFPNSKAKSLLNTVISEAKCERIHSVVKPHPLENDISTNNKSEEPCAKRLKVDNGSEEIKQCDKDKLEDRDLNISTEDQKNGKEGKSFHDLEEMPLFYYHIHQQRYSSVPRSDVLVSRLKEAGYRASRTHFDSRSIRTNATLKQMQAIIERTTKCKKL